MNEERSTNKESAIEFFLIRRASEARPPITKADVNNNSRLSQLSRLTPCGHARLKSFRIRRN